MIEIIKEILKRNNLIFFFLNLDFLFDKKKDLVKKQMSI